jgi:hypothetical protein
MYNWGDDHSQEGLAKTWQWRSYESFLKYEVSFFYSRYLPSTY